MNSARVCIRPYVLLKLMFCLQNGLKIYLRIQFYLLFIFVCIYMFMYVCHHIYLYTAIQFVCIHVAAEFDSKNSTL